MNRKKLPFNPVFYGVYQQWAYKEIERNFWRLHYLYDADDLAQDAYLKFLQCQLRYVGVVETPEHFMSLYKTAFKNHLHDLASSTITSSGISTVDEAEEFDEVVEDGYGELAVLLSRAPYPLSLLFFAIETVEFNRLLTKSRKRQSYGSVSHRETTNELFCRLLGLDPLKVNLYESAKAYLQG